jgi:ATP-binding cassette subfamily F protein uup
VRLAFRQREATPMTMIGLKSVSIAFGGPPLLNGVDLDIGENERIGVVGRNGAGKSTLFNLLCGRLAPDTGNVTLGKHVRLAHLPQEVPADLSGSIAENVALGVPSVGRLLADELHAGQRAADGRGTHRDDRARRRALTAAEAWSWKPVIDRTLSRLGLDPRACVETLSAGWKRRVLLAKALVSDPNLLLLDEPTNHLDLEAIRWLERFITSFRGTLLIVSHDRMLLRRVTRKVLELDRGAVFLWPVGYDIYKRRKDAVLVQEASTRRRDAKLLAREEAWLRRGLKARRARNEGRVRALERLRKLRDTRRSRAGDVAMSIGKAPASGKMAIDVEGIGYRWHDQVVVAGLTCRIMRGDKVGVIGPNGAGKTTLLQLLLKQLPPSQGQVRHGSRLRVAYFDQLRSQLDPDRSVIENISEVGDHITINGRPRHVIGYLKGFLFSNDRLRCPVRVLSGGERNRLLLAKLFSQPANLLVLDEPTNDLDTETIELLEERLINYDGTLLLVSHDREFINNVVTSILAIGKDGAVLESVGGYDDWRTSQPDQSAKRDQERTTRAKTLPKRQNAPPRTRLPGKLGFNEQRELAALPERIDQLETEQQDLYRQLADPAFYREAPRTIAAAKARLENVDKALVAAYRRWERLEEGQE